MTQSLLDGFPEVAGRFARSPRVVLGLDYDGTLTPIVEEPKLARLRPETRSLLTALAAQPRLWVAIVNGRGLSDLQTIVDIPGIIYAGDHGLDISGPGRRFIETDALRQQVALSEIARELNAKLKPIAGAVLELKALTLSVHFRRVAPDDWNRVRLIVDAAIENAGPAFHRTTGHRVLEVRPRVAWNKGQAVAWIRDQLASADSLVIYVGDDETDEDVFRSLPEALTVKVGGPEATSAAYFLDSPADVHDVLARLSAIPRPEEHR